jgi:hypothetical protein
LDDDLEAADTWQTKIEYNDIGPVLAVHHDSRFSIAGFPDDSDL